MRVWRLRKELDLEGEGGYILPLVMLVLVVVGMMAAALMTSVLRNDQHVSRDRAYTQSLAVAEAGLNQYLWLVASGKSSESNNFIIPGDTVGEIRKATVTLADADDAVKGTYNIQIIPPWSDDPRITVKVTGAADSSTGVARTVSAHIGRPCFSEYVLLVNDSVYIGGAPDDPDRQWFGKTHSNTGIRIETWNINDTVTCSRSSYTYEGSTKPGIWSQYLASNDPSRALWSFPVPSVDFNTVTSDFVRLSSKATGIHNLAYVTPTSSGAAHGWYIKLLPNLKYQVAQVTGESESKSYVSGNNRGGYLTYGTLSAVRDYPADGVIYANDNVWIEGTGLDGRITVACSGQLNATGKTAATSINVVGDLTYSTYDGKVAVGLIAQNNLKIPMYAPMGKSGTMGTSISSPGSVDMRIDAALIAQQGAEFVSRDSSASPWGPRRRLLTFYGSVSSLGTPSRATTSGETYCGFAQGANSYDRFLLNTPPPFFPTIGTYQILDWQELLPSQAVSPDV
jgi:type II secretory pathway pseudopilin PulG